MSVRFADYRAAVTTPGAGPALAASALGRLPIAMVGLAVLLYVQRTTGSFASAGIVSAAVLLGVSLGAVAQGRLIDRRGPTGVLLVAAGLFALATAALLVLVDAGAPVPLLALAAVQAGLVMPGLPGASRSLWTALLPPGPRRDAAYGYEAISLEVFFVLGPEIAALLVTAPWPGTGAVAAAAAMVVGTVGFALAAPVRAMRGTARTARTPLLGALAEPGMRTVALASLGFGVVIGSVEVGVPAVTAAAGSATLGGVLLSAWSVTSVVGGLGYARRPWPRPLDARLGALLGGFGLAVAAVTVTGSVVALAAVMLVAGVLITPQTTAHSMAVDVAAPPGTGTEAFGWVITAATVGIAAGQSAGGIVVEQAGPHAAFLVGGVAGTVLALVVWCRRATVATEPTPAAAQPRR